MAKASAAHVRMAVVLGLIAAIIVGVALPALINAAMQNGITAPSRWTENLRVVVIGVLATGSWVLLLGWFAVLFEGNSSQTDKTLAVDLGQAGEPEIKQEKSEKPLSPESN